LTKHLVLGEVAHAVGTGYEGVDERASQLSELDGSLCNVRGSAKARRDLERGQGRRGEKAHFRPLYLAVPVSKRMEESEEPSHELASPHGLIQPLRVHERSLEQLNHDVDVPSRMVLGAEDLSCEKSVAEVRVVDLHPREHLGRFDLALTALERVVEGVGSTRRRKEGEDGAERGIVETSASLFLRKWSACRGGQNEHAPWAWIFADPFLQLPSTLIPVERIDGYKGRAGRQPSLTSVEGGSESEEPRESLRGRSVENEISESEVARRRTRKLT